MPMSHRHAKQGVFGRYTFRKKFRKNNFFSEKFFYPLTPNSTI